MINHRYHADHRIITFLPHTMSTHGKPWIYTIICVLRKSGYSPVGVFLWEDYSITKKRSRLVSMIEADQYLILYGEKEDGIDDIPDTDKSTGKKLTSYPFQKPPGTGEVRRYLSNNPSLFEKDNIFSIDEDELPLSQPIREYIYQHKLYVQPCASGNVTDAFRNVFGTSLGKLLGRVPMADGEVKTNVVDKLEALGIKI